jgi:hypothetical protein
MSSTTRRDIPELPTLDPGVTLLTGCNGPSHHALQTLAVDHLLCDGGTAIWVGPGHQCVTDTFAQIAPDRRVLDRIHLARGFTPYQHTALLRHLPERVTEETSILVLPEVDRHYRGDDVQGLDGRTMFVRALAAVGRVAREFDIPVLCTRTAADGFTEPLETLADESLTVTETAQGPRFVGEEFETLVYPLGNGWVQTTLAFWQDILEARAPLYATGGFGTEVDVHGPH